MKKACAIFVAFWITAIVLAQPPERMSYQAIIRDSSDQLLTNQAVGMQISILKGSADGPAVYVETHSPGTDVNGLVTIKIGGGAVVAGHFSAIDWANDLYFIKTETDPTTAGGTNYTITGTSQLLSVPYALHAKTAESLTGDMAGSVWKKNEHNVYYNDMNEGQSRLYFHPNGNLSYHDSWGEGARFHVGDDDPDDTTVAINAYSVGGTSIQGMTNAGSDRDWMNAGVSGIVFSEAGTSGRGVAGRIEGGGSGGFGVHGSAGVETGWNLGVAGVALSRDGNSQWQKGGEFLARGDWDLAHGTGTGSHFGITTQASGGGDWSVGAWSRADGSHVSGNNFGGQFVGLSQIRNSGHNYGIRAMADSSSFVNRGIVATTNGKGEDNTGGFFVAQGMGHPTLETFNYGVFGRAADNRVANIGVMGAANATVDPGALCVGVYGMANAADTTYGVYAIATGYNPVNYGIYAKATNGSDANHAGFFEGDVTVTGNLNVAGDIAKGGGTIKTDHPLDPQNKYLIHGFVGSPEMMNVYSGNITTDAGGRATVHLPDYFEAANKDFRYQLTCIGAFAQAIVMEEISNNAFVVQTNEPHVKVSWQVTAVRNDPYARHHPIVPEQVKNGNERGAYLHPEVFGKNISERVYPPKTHHRGGMATIKDLPVSNPPGH